MTKKERILAVALERFSQSGFDAVSTASIAAAAEVSEGLIFRHFKNKQGLLDALRVALEVKLAALIQPVIEAKSPAGVLTAAFDTLLAVPPEDFDFWKLQYKLKLDDNYQVNLDLQPYVARIVGALEALGYAEPILEAQLLMEIGDTTLKRIAYGEIDNPEEFVRFLRKKYGVN